MEEWSKCHAIEGEGSAGRAFRRRRRRRQLLQPSSTSPSSVASTTLISSRASTRW
jgi:hypothetical protein